MSACVYGALNAQREQAPRETSKEEEPPGFGTYLDVVSALVPAEILAANAVLLPLVTEATTDESGNAVTTVTDPTNLKLVFWLSIVFCILLYFVGDRARAKKAARRSEDSADGEVEVEAISWGGWNWIRALIPAGSYVAWTMLQKATAFDAVSQMSEAKRLIIAVFGAIALGVTAKALADKADSREPPEPEPEPMPEAPPAPA